MKVLVTGGAGFIGRWVVKKLIEKGCDVWVLDNLANGRRENLDEFAGNEKLKDFVVGNIKDRKLLRGLFGERFDACFHLAASINVQDSIDDPRTTYENDVDGAFNVLEESRRTGARLMFVSTCMVYDRATDDVGISERHPVKPASPYAGAKLAAENMVLSYYHAYGMPTTVIRPFNTYGPFQKSSGEGGVVAIFIGCKLNGAPLTVYGDGTQTRDLLYVEDCADFVLAAGLSDRAVGRVINAGLGEDIAINDLAMKVVGDPSRIVHVEHIHPQSEIMRLRCDNSLARSLLGWSPKVSLDEGLRRTEAWIERYGIFA